MDYPIERVVPEAELCLTPRTPRTGMRPRRLLAELLHEVVENRIETPALHPKVSRSEVLRAPAA